MTNPLTQPSGEGGNFPELEGKYVCTLKEVETVRGKAYQSDEEVDKLQWVFWTDESIEGMKARVSKRTSVSTWAKKSNPGGPALMLMELDPKGLKNCTRVDDKKNVCDANEMWELVQSQVGKQFLVEVEHNNGWNNYVSAEPWDESMMGEREHKAPSTPQASGGDSDDIPF